MVYFYFVIGTIYSLHSSEELKWGVDQSLSKVPIPEAFVKLAYCISFVISTIIWPVCVVYEIYHVVHCLIVVRKMSADGLKKTIVWLKANPGDKTYGDYMLPICKRELKKRKVG